MPGKFGRHKHSYEHFDNTPGGSGSGSGSANQLPEGHIVSEFPDVLDSIEEATKPTGKAVVIDAEGKETRTVVHKHPEGGDRYAWGTLEGPASPDAWVEGSVIEDVNKTYGDKGFRPIR